MRSFALAWLGVLASAAPARAQDYDAAAKHFGVAQVAFSQQHYRIAAGEFQSAYDIAKDPVLLYNVAESWEKAGEGQKAVAAYRAYLKSKPDADDKSEVQRRIHAIEVKRFRLVDQSAPDQPPPPKPAPPRPVEPPPPPPTKIESTALPTPTTAPESPVQNQLAPLPTTPPPAEREPPPPAGLLDEGPMSRAKTVAWIGVATTVALLTTGGILGLAAQSRADELSRRLSTVDMTGQPLKYDAAQQMDFQTLKSEGQLYNGLAIGFLCGAGAAAVTTAILFIADARHPAAKQALRLEPALGRGLYGLAAGGTF